MDKIRVVIAEDNPNVRKGLCNLLNQSPEIEICGQTGDGLEVLQLVANLQPDVLLLDLQLPGMTGFEIAQKMAEQRDKTRILVISAYDDTQYIDGMLSFGVRGYILKDEAPFELAKAVVAICSGRKVWLSPSIAARLERLHQRQPRAQLST